MGRRRGPDEFELAIGNHIAHSVPLWQGGGHFAELRAEWLPYYEEGLRLERLEMVRNACLRDLEFVSFYLRRDLWFGAFDRLYKAFQEFLQGLFIAHRAYPVAYNKWVREQLCDDLHLPELYRQLPALIQVERLESEDLVSKGELLRELASDRLVP